MKWAKLTKYCLVSDTGYKVCKVYVNDEVKYRASNPKGVFISGYVDSAEEAKRACE